MQPMIQPGFSAPRMVLGGARIAPFLALGLFLGLQAGPVATEPVLEPGRKAQALQRSKAEEARLNARARRAVASAIRSFAQPFDGPDHLPPALLKAIEGKRLVGLGEGTHGTSELVRTRANLVLTCAKTGKVAVLMEDQGEAFAALNHWIHGEGDEGQLPALLSSAFSINNTVEMGDFLKAARALNARAQPGQGLDIYGIDIQVAGKAANNPIPGLRAWCSGHGLALDSELTLANTWVEACRKGNYVPGSLRSEARGAISMILGEVAQAGPKVEGWPAAMIAANNLDRFAEFDQASTVGVFSTTTVNRFQETVSDSIANGIRDAGMAANVKVLLDNVVKGQAFFWGHNAHVGRMSLMDMDPQGVSSSWANTGSLLGMWLGDSYVPIAFETGAGTFRAQLMDEAGTVQPYQAIKAPVLPRDAINAIASSVVGKPVFIRVADLPFMDSRRPEMAAGSIHSALVPEASVGHTIPRQAYFAIISFPVSTATQPMK